MYKVLAGLEFSGKLFEAKAQTTIGNELINKYRTYLVANPATCGTVNSFLREARGISYDTGIQAVVEAIAETIDANKFGWALASVCESIENGGNGHSNYLQMRAVEQVRPMLEMDENQIVSYIKSGALKDVMYVESFRNIARAIYREQPVIEYSDQYTAVHPVALCEKGDTGFYFHAGAHLFRVNESGIYEATQKDVSREFLVVANMIESGMVKLKDGALVMEAFNRIYKVEEKDGDEKIATAIETKVESVKNKTYRPYLRDKFTVVFGKGIDNDAGIVETAISEGVIKKKGGWYSIDGSNVAQGLPALKEYLDTNPSVYERIKKETLEAIKPDEDELMDSGANDADSMTDDEIAEKVMNDNTEVGEV